MQKKTIVILSNTTLNIYLFKMNLLKRLTQLNYNVVVVASDVGYVKSIENVVNKYISYPIETIGVNPIQEFKTYYNLKKILLYINPNVVISYTIKPNIYSNIILKKHKSKVINIISGRGRVFSEKYSFKKLIIGSLFKHALKKSDCIYLNNYEDLNYMINSNYLNIKKCNYLRGEGTDINKFKTNKEKTFETIDFLFLGRLLVSKGIEDYLSAGIELKKRYPNIIIHVAGYSPKGDPDSIDTNIINDLDAKNEIIYHGWIEDQISIYEKINCIVLPTYYNEGMPISLMEAASMSLPVICSNISACKQIVVNEYNGFLCNPKDSKNLMEQMEKFILLSDEEKKQMGINARIKAEKEFDATIIANKVINDFELMLKN